MSKDEVKEFLYKNNPDAHLWNVRKDGIYYTARVEDKIVTFLVPLSELGEIVWDTTMHTKFLIRYLQ